MLENEIWTIGRDLPLATFGSERVNTTQFLLLGTGKKVWAMADRRVTIPENIDLFTYTTAILNYLDLRSIMGCPGGHEHDPIYSLSVYACFSGQLSFPRKRL